MSWRVMERHGASWRSIDAYFFFTAPLNFVIMNWWFDGLHGKAAERASKYRARNGAVEELGANFEALKRVVEEQGKTIAKIEKELKKLRKEVDPAPQAPAPEEPATAPAKKLVKGTVAALFAKKK